MICCKSEERTSTNFWMLIHFQMNTNQAMPKLWNLWTIQNIKSLSNTWLYKDLLKMKRKALNSQWSLLIFFHLKITPLLTLFYPMAISKLKSNINKLKKSKSKLMMKMNHIWLNKHPLKKRLKLKNHRNLRIKMKTQMNKNNKLLKLKNKPKKNKFKLNKQNLSKKKKRKSSSNKKS